MKSTLPELIEKRAGAHWRHTPAPTRAGAPTANRNTRTISHDTDDNDTAHAQRLAALVASRHNTRRPKQIAEIVGDTPDDLALFHAAQELRNRLWAARTTIGRNLPPPRYYLPEQLAAHHATTPPEQLAATLAEQLAAIIHHPQDLAAYLTALHTRHDSPNLARAIKDTATLINDHAEKQADALRTKPKQRHAERIYTTNGTKRRLLTNAEYAAHLTHYFLNSLNQHADALARRDKQHQRKTKRDNRRRKIERTNGGKAGEQDLSGWYPVIMSKPDRELTHTGRLGRRRIATNTGKNPNRIHNYAGDPARRIFSRNTRGTNALVIVDASGSMSLTADDLGRIMTASAGATVIAYSAADDHTSNTHLLAHKGRKVRNLPRFPGNNGNDAPAAAYAIANYRKTGAPVLWITDGRATGRGDTTNAELRAQCRKLAQKHGVIVSPNVEQALADLAAIKAGKRPPQRLHTFH